MPDKGGCMRKTRKTDVLIKKVFALLLSAMGLCLTAHPQTKAIVSLSANYMREHPEYEAELGTQALMGTVVEVLDSVSYWRLVRTPDGYEAWTTAMGLAPYGEGYEAAGKLMVTALFSQVLSAPQTASRPVSDLVRGDVLLAAPDGLRPRRERRGSGFVPVALPDGRRGWVPEEDVEEYGSWASGRESTGEATAEEALRYVGIPYLWGGSSPKGFDCSGLTQMAYRMCGIELPRNASQQARLGEEIRMDGQGIDPSALQPGDLLFFGRTDPESGAAKVTHVGLYIGDGRMVHSSQLVRVNAVVHDQPDSYEGLSRFLFARRVL